MRHKITNAILAIILIAAGMFGLHSKIEYSGWVLFIGLLAAINL